MWLNAVTVSVSARHSGSLLVFDLQASVSQTRSSAPQVGQVVFFRFQLLLECNMLESVYSIVKMAIQSFLGHVTFLDGKKKSMF